MGYIDDISAKLKKMKDKSLHDEFMTITERMIATNSTDMLPVIYRIIEHYDFIARQNKGLQQTNEHLHQKLYNRSDQYTGGFYTKGGKGQL